MRLRYGSQERLQVRPHDFFNAARYAASILDEIGHIEIAALMIELERFERDIQAKLVPILPGISDTLFLDIDANSSVVNSISLNAFTPRSARKPKRANRRIIQDRTFGPTRQRDIDRVGHLSRQFVKGQGRHKTDHRLRELAGNDHQVRVGKRRQISQSVKSATEY